jgi:hypothetical protein
LKRRAKIKSRSAAGESIAAENATQAQRKKLTLKLKERS